MDQTMPVFSEEGYVGPFARLESNQIALYVHRCEEESCRIFRSSSTDGLTFDTPQPIAFQSVDLRDPFIYPTKGGDMVYGVDRDQSHIIRMRLDGQGEPEVMYTATDGETVHDPSIITIDGQTVIFAIVRQNDISSFSRLVDGTFEPLELSLCVETTDVCWARGHIQSAEVRALRTALGRPMYRVLFSIEGAAGQGVWGFAQSSTGLSWSAFPFNPGVESSAHLGAATQVRSGGRYLIYGEAGRRRPRVITAVNDSGWPSMVWAPTPGQDSGAN